MALFGLTAPRLMALTCFWHGYRPSVTTGEDGSYVFATHAAPKDNLASSFQPSILAITARYDVQYVDWELRFGVGVSALRNHVLSYPEITPVAAAKQALIDAVANGDDAWMAGVAETWNNSCQFHKHPRPTHLCTYPPDPYVLGIG